MAQQSRPPKLYVTSQLLEVARDEGITGVTAYDSAHGVIQRGSRGSLRGLSVSRLILHTEADIDVGGLKVYRVKSYDSDAASLETSNLPGTHPHDFIAKGLPAVHSLVVPVEEFDPTAIAWSLHYAADRYRQELDLPPAGKSELRPPMQGFGNPALDDALGAGLLFFGKLVSGMQAEGKREAPEALAEELWQGIGPIIGRGIDTIRAVQDLPDGADASNQSPLLPFTPAEMADLVAQNPPIVFHSK